MHRTEDLLESNGRCFLSVCASAPPRGGPVLVFARIPGPGRKSCRGCREAHLLLAFAECRGGPTARSPLDEERDDQPGLEQQDSREDRNLKSIPSPRARFAELNDGIWRQQLLVDAPTAYLPPIDHRHLFERSGSDLRRPRRAFQELHRRCTCVARQLLEGRHVAAYDAGAEVRIELAIDGNYRCLGHALHRVTGAYAFWVRRIASC